MNGSSDNSTPAQFISAYRKLLHNCDILISNFSNITNQLTSDILTVSSSIKPSCPAQDQIIAEEAEAEEWNEVMELQSLDNCNAIIDAIDAGVSFVAHALEKRLLTNNIYCDFCKEVLEKSEKVNDFNFQMGKPCLSTYQICKLTDTALKSVINSGPNFKQKTYLAVMNNLNFDEIFSEFYEPVHDVDHKHFLIKFFIDEYTNKKCAYVAKQKTLSLQKRYIRNSYRKKIHFMNQ